MNPGSFKDDRPHPQHLNVTTPIPCQPDQSPPTQGHHAHLQPGLESTDLNAVASALLHSLSSLCNPLHSKDAVPTGTSLCSARPLLKVPQVGGTEHYYSLKRQEDIEEEPSGRNTGPADAPERHSDRPT